MPSVGTYGVKDKKCGTCRWWGGVREVVFSGNKPKYVKAEAVASPCLAQKNKATTPGNTCPKFSTWEKLVPPPQVSNVVEDYLQKKSESIWRSFWS